MNLYDWLFECKPQNWIPQTGGATVTKKAVWWRPGKKIHTIRPTPLTGCTQLAFPPETQIAEGHCAVCWLGIDVDLDEPLTLDQLYRLQDLHCSIRTSSGGTGVHLIWRLAEPTLCNYSQSNQLVKQLLQPFREQVEEFLPVCSADRRMFWLEGGKNMWLYQTDKQLSTPWNAIPAHPPIIEAYVADLPIQPSVQQWVDGMVQDKVLRGAVGKHNRIHLGTIVPWLRSQGEIVNTVSGLSPEWHVNGHLDIYPDRLALYSYADSRIIWSWTDADSILANF